VRPARAASISAARWIPLVCGALCPERARVVHGGTHGHAPVRAGRARGGAELRADVLPGELLRGELGNARRGARQNRLVAVGGGARGPEALRRARKPRLQACQTLRLHADALALGVEALRLHARALLLQRRALLLRPDPLLLHADARLHRGESTLLDTSALVRRGGVDLSGADARGRARLQVSVLLGELVAQLALGVRVGVDVGQVTRAVVIPLTGDLVVDATDEVARDRDAVQK
jgi:hypothetical protein